MDIFKIFAIAVTGTFLYIFVKQHKPEFAAAVQTATVLIIFVFVLSYAGAVISQIKEITESYNLKSEFIFPMIKALGIAVITQITADLCRDNGNTSAGAKVEFAGRIIIIAMILFGVAAVYFKRFVDYADVTISACIQTSTSAIVCFIYAIIQNGWSDIESRTMNVKPIAFLWPMLTGCISSGLGVHMFMILIDQLKAFGSNFITFGQMIVGLVIGVAILGDWKGYNWWMILLNIAGFVIIIIGMALGFIGEDEKKKQTEEDNVEPAGAECNSESEPECYYEDVYPAFTQRRNASECPS